MDEDVQVSEECVYTKKCVVIYSGVPSDLSNSEIVGLAGSLLFVL
jgi:hypothetical protein